MRSTSVLIRNKHQAHLGLLFLPVFTEQNYGSFPAGGRPHLTQYPPEAHKTTGSAVFINASDVGADSE
jgi:hypothetical protein